MDTLRNSNIIKGYQALIYDNGPVRFHDYMSNKYDKVHNQLFEDAISKYFEHYFIDIILSQEFLWEFFNLACESIWNPKEMVAIMKRYPSQYGYVYDSLKMMNLDDEKAIETIFNLIDDEISYLKSHIGDNNLLDVVQIMDPKDLVILWRGEAYYYGYDDDMNLSIQKMSEEVISESEYVWWHSAQERYIILEEFRMLDADGQPFVWIRTTDPRNADPFYVISFTEVEISESRIGMNKEGEWCIEILNDIDFYYLEEKFMDIIRSKKKNTLSRFLWKDVKDLYDRYHRYIESKNQQYWEASTLINIGLRRPYSKESIYLEPWWNMYQRHMEQSLEDIRITGVEKNVGSQLQYIDYVKGKAIMETRVEGDIYDVDFQYLDENTDISEEYTLKNTFMNKYITNKYK